MYRLIIAALFTLSILAAGCGKADEAKLNKDASDSTKTPPKKLQGAANAGGPGKTDDKKSGGSGPAQVSTTP